ncbi:MAG: S8 family serine peptidase [Planctomycetes bacterium]|nr:S8 family serine peptidase [Planctomycetota bacterium]
MPNARCKILKITALSLSTLMLTAIQAYGQSYQPQSLESIQARSLQYDHPELLGQSVTVGLVELCQPSSHDDSGYTFLPNLEHQALNSTNWLGVYCYRNPDRPIQYSNHASLIAGILFGQDPQSNYPPLNDFVYQGMVPAASANLYETNWFIYKRIFVPGTSPAHEDVLTMSWGTDANDVITMWWQHGVDALVERDRCTVVAGCGNGTDDFNSITKPSWGYNVISVGAARGLGTFPDNLRYVGPPLAKYSSTGPTDDGRAKPDVIAPGNTLGPGIDSNDQYWGTETLAGYSSFASPHAAGLAALLIDAARLNEIENADDPRVIKALILNGAQKLVGWHKGTDDPNDDHEVPLDYAQGAGLINAQSAYKHLISGRDDPNSGPQNIGWDLNHIALTRDDPDSVRVYAMPQPLEAGDKFKATLTWYRHYDQSRLYQALPLSNLNLELWQLDPNGNRLSLLDYSASTRDNVQHIYYHSTVRQKVALLVRGNQAESSHRTHETYALAYCGGEENWEGDLLLADVNVDGIVDRDDALIMMNAWAAEQGIVIESDKKKGISYLSSDLNLNGRIDIDDFELLSQQWQQRSPWYHEEKNNDEDDQD